MPRQASGVPLLASVLLAAFLAGCAVPSPSEVPSEVLPGGATSGMPGALQVHPGGPSAGVPPSRSRRRDKPRLSAPPAARESDASPSIEQGDEGEEESGVLLGRGLASWYGASLHGRRTASGERFDRGELTAAHRTLPFGARVCVRSLVNGKVVVVRVNDRGPFAPGRVIDLSQAAAQELGMVGLGIKPVEIWHMGPDDDSCPEHLPELDASLESAAKPDAAVNPGAAADVGKEQGPARAASRKNRPRRR